MAGSGCLYLVATPIGNLEDITLRALDTLANVDRVAAEDTRVARKLLDRHGIDKPLVSCHAHTAGPKLEALANAMAAGERLAFISDAGTPGISDPGHELVCLAVSRGVTVVPIPGASALTALLSVADLPAGRFVFEGFLPREGKARRRLLRTTAAELRPTVFFEGPHRLEDTLTDLLAIWGDRRVVIGRELTKLHEEVFRGSLSEALARFTADPPRGELSLLVAGASAEAPTIDPEPEASPPLRPGRRERNRR
ncbi:MAG: 16S rRNA (cytidine(1402)-2'-O)-methyltransferase [Candidatus Sericytochromatia bacterium]|nr:16S rRNA (cytidine(1402)-2'-O)-methyltransferase [Candidatus Sericytochromatia bacterium]